MLSVVKRGYLVEEAQFWLPLVELILPFLDKEVSQIEDDVYNDVIVDLKLLMLKSPDMSIHCHDYLNEHCHTRGTPEFMFVEEILDKEKIDSNLDACMKQKEVDLKSKFYQTFFVLQVKEAVHGDKDYKRPLQELISKQVRSNACRIVIPMEFEAKLRNRETLNQFDAVSVIRSIKTSL
jgi:hypothetical protein